MAFVDLPSNGRSLRIEYAWVGSDRIDSPLVVFLHEGLGSLALWREFPETLCQALGARGLVYSRPGYGRSTPRAPDERWAPDFMHRQAHEVLPSLLSALKVQQPIWLFGHSDGGSIALLYATRYPVSGLIVLAPHILVESLSVTSIEKARVAYETGGLRERLSRYHDDTDSAFWGWNRIWLDPDFRNWSIQDEIETISCPVLAIQGLDDEYGTLEQVYGIARRLPQTRVLELPDCGHSPHRDQAHAVTQACIDFIASQRVQTP